MLTKLPWAACCGLVLLLVGGAWWTDEVFALRDAGNFYYPLFKWQCEEWAEGRIPLWNPYDGLGTPVLADATSSVLYPGKLIFAAPLPYPARFNLYIIAHLLLAVATTYRLARAWKCSRDAAALAAAAYVCSGSVLFQTCNVVFLVGAAWLPCALQLGDAMLTSRRVLPAVGLGVVLALMTLGGDPQTAYHAVLLVLLHAGLLRLQYGRKHRLANAHSGWPRLTLRGSVVAVSLAVGTGLALAAVQVLPSASWTQRSHRAFYAAPRNVWETCEYLVRAEREGAPLGQTLGTITHGLVGQPSPGTHASQIYAYSVGPWRLLELAFPNVSGSSFPIHRRWLSALPAEGAIWTPTLYAGVITLLLAISAWRWRSGTRQERWAVAMVVFGTLASWGSHGAGWLVHEVSAGVFQQPDAASWLGDATGGLYWLLVVALPGYVFFRFPAKWLVVATLGIALLAGRGMDRLPTRRQTFLRSALMLVGISLALAVGLLVVQPWWVAWLAPRVHPHAIFGPFDAAGAWGEVLRSFLHAALIAGAVCVVCQGYATRTPARTAWRRIRWGLLVLTLLDLGIAHRWLVATTSLAHLQTDTAHSEIARSKRQAMPPPRVVHAGLRSWTVPAWQQACDPRRLDHVVQWERSTLRYKYHLLDQVAVINSLGTLNPADLQSFLRLVPLLRDPTRIEESAPLLAAVGVETFLVPPTKGRLDPGVEPAQVSDKASWSLVENPEQASRVWISRELRAIPPLPTRDLGAMQAQFRSLWREGAEARGDFRKTAVVEARADFVHPHASKPPAQVSERCEITRYEPQRIDVAVETRAASVLVLADLYDPDWQVEILPAGSAETVDPPPSVSPTLRVNGLLRGTYLPPGAWGVSFVYRPRRFLWGAGVSFIAWLFLTVVAYAAWRGSKGKSGLYRRSEASKV